MGNGWDGAEWTAFSAGFGKVAGPYTTTYQSTGSGMISYWEPTEEFCMPQGNITVKLYGGRYGSQVRWRLKSGGSITASGLAEGYQDHVTYEESFQL